MGKESWNDGGSWGVGSGKSRDDDYGEGKKRKFNNPVCKLDFDPLLLTWRSSLRPGTMAVTTLITVIKIMGLGVVSMATRSASSPATLAHMSFFLGLT
jgi:hypothetical protein